jgi:hypothetical protein
MVTQQDIDRVLAEAERRRAVIEKQIAGRARGHAVRVAEREAEGRRIAAEAAAEAATLAQRRAETADAIERRRVEALAECEAWRAREASLKDWWHDVLAG